MATRKTNGALVVVESPAKARTIGRILSSGYQVEASMGHVRDLPEWTLGVDIGNDFAPRYLNLRDKKKVIAGIKHAAEKASSIYLATDPDREGEAIAWHLLQAIELKKLPPVHRVVFHEITPEAVSDAFKHPRTIDMNLVDAQQARRVLDRLVGFKISRLLQWRIRPGLSAGRVQSAALKMIADREREIKEFVPRPFWTIEAVLERLTPPSGAGFRATLAGLKDAGKLEMASQEECDGLVDDLKKCRFSVASVQTRESPRLPAAPFTTSTLQQEAWRKLRFTAQRTMSIAQRLYEGVDVGAEGSVGLITYMRTDSSHVAASALTETREFIKEVYGPKYLPHSPRTFSRKSKWSQEAHEAIRPTRIHRRPADIAKHLDPAQMKLYELIWKRMVASQMAAAIFDNTSVEVEAASRASRKKYVLKASSSEMKFPGFMSLYVEDRDEADPKGRASPLPHLEAGEGLKCADILSEKDFTQPLPRFTEATLVKTLEQQGIGRPSTYAQIISTIQQRDYVHKEQGKFHADEIGMTVTAALAKHFPRIVDLQFTARLEEKLDEVAHGHNSWVATLQGFWEKFEPFLKDATEKMEKVRTAEPTNETCPECRKPILLRTGRFGKFYGCSGYPECRYTRPFVTLGVKCPECGKPLVQRKGKKTRRVFYGCSGYPDCKFISRYRPLAEPCPKCGKLLVAYGKDGAKCATCDYKGKVAQAQAEVIAA